MGIARGAVRLLLDESKKRPFQGSILQLGKQNCYFSMEDLRKWALLHGLSLRDLAKIEKSNIKDLADNGYIDSTTFFSALGFDKVESCDYSDFEGATHIFDFNLPAPKELHGRYDVIFDGGTIEHVFNLPMALSNIHSLLKPGGRIFHVSPSSNYLEHGFYMFSPTFFHDYYLANRYQLDAAYLFEMRKRNEGDVWRVFQYQPGVMHRFIFVGVGKGKRLGVYFAATKTEKSVSDIIPQQGYYNKAWNDTDADSQASPFAPGKPGAIRAKVKRMIKNFPRLTEAVAGLYWGIKKPPLYAKY